MSPAADRVEFEFLTVSVVFTLPIAKSMPFLPPSSTAPDSEAPPISQNRNKSKVSLSEQIRLGNSDLMVSRIGLGCWPMSGISSIGVTDEQSIATIRAAMECGIRFFDTAYSYGYDGRSDLVLEEAIRGRRSEVVIAHKVGSHWDSEGKRCIDGSRQRLMDQAEQCLRRLKTDFVDVMYLHTPDPNTPLEESANVIRAICEKGWARYAAVSNVTADQAERFHRVCPIIAIQPYFNIFQQDAVQLLRPIATRLNIAMVCYWVLMKGLLAGKLLRDHNFDPNDRRLSYPIFQGDAWHRAQDLLDHLRLLAMEYSCTVAQLVTAWSLNQPGVSVALVGAKTPQQIIESAAALQIELSNETLTQIGKWIPSEFT